MPPSNTIFFSMFQPYVEIIFASVLTSIGIYVPSSREQIRLSHEDNLAHASSGRSVHVPNNVVRKGCPHMGEVYVFYTRSFSAGS